MNSATRSRVNAETVMRVLDAAGKLGYRANATARALRLQRSQAIGVIVPDLTNPIIPPIVQGIESVVADAGYVVLLGDTAHSDERERLYVDAMTSNQVGGIISAAAHANDDALADAMTRGIAVVLVLRAVDDGSIAAAVPDDRLCSELAVAHLEALGHRRIAHVASPQSTSTGVLRRAGFEEALARDLIAALLTLDAAAPVARLTAPRLPSADVRDRLRPLGEHADLRARAGQRRRASPRRMRRCRASAPGGQPRDRRRRCTRCA